MIQHCVADVKIFGLIVRWLVYLVLFSTLNTRYTIVSHDNNTENAMATLEQLTERRDSLLSLGGAELDRIIKTRGALATATSEATNLSSQALTAAQNKEFDVANKLIADAKVQADQAAQLEEQLKQQQSTYESLKSQFRDAEAAVVAAETGAGQTQTGSTNTGDGETANPPTPGKKAQADTTLTPEQDGEIPEEFQAIPQQTIAERTAGDNTDPFANPIEVVTPPVALLDLTQTGQQNPNLVTAKNLLNNGQKSAYGTGAKDWRLRISLASSANYLYKAGQPGILKPLQATDGVIFPYTPAINITYSASYNASDLTHTNYKIYNYHNSAVENVGITGDFTAQDSAEANYLLAVIHFFKSVTKMFYGQDQNPSRGIPPPLVYLSGFGQYQFDRHPCVITNFTYNLPVDVDYINAYPTNNSSAIGGVNMQPYMPQIAKWLSPLDRLRALTSKIQPGGLPPPPQFQKSQNINEITRVPTKMSIQLTAIPIVTRNAISNQFSLQKYATGELMRGSVNPKAGGGIW
jgi:hypothetical protein